jgi:hypothetical protein
VLYYYGFVSQQVTSENRSNPNQQPNPDKCEFLIFARRQAEVEFTVQGVPRKNQSSARYLGLIFSGNGSWDQQLQVALSRSRSALGRCKIMI